MFLVLATFPLTLLGAFLMRSGVLTSVHSFAADPARGAYLPAFPGLAMVAGFGLLIWRAETLDSEADIESPLSREARFSVSRAGRVLEVMGPQVRFHPGRDMSTTKIAIRAEGRYRVFVAHERQAGAFPRSVMQTPQDPREIVVWCSNDDLGMGQHPAALAAMKTAVDRFGAGAGGTRNISGTHGPIAALERELTELHGKAAALVFGCGWLANHATLSALRQILPDCLILSDAGNHASMIEGIRAAHCERAIFRHNDREHLETLLAAQPRNRCKVIVFESVHSMEGDFAPIAEIVRLDQRYAALTYLDEVHAVGPFTGRPAPAWPTHRARPQGSTSPRARRPRASASWVATSPDRRR